MARRRALARTLLIPAFTAVVIAGAADPLAAQRVERVGAGVAELDRRIDRVLVAGSYRLLTRDTLLDADDVVAATLLVLDATVRVEGTVRGDLVAVDANVYLRPSARIEGDVVNAGGGLYPSALATVTGTFVDRPLARYRVRRTAAGYRIEARTVERRLTLPGFGGLRVPHYNRVDGLAVRWGASYRLAAVAGTDPVAHARVGYATERGAITGGVELEVRRGSTALFGGAERVTATNEDWIRSASSNSLSFFGVGNDYRNYHDARRLFLGLRWADDRPGRTLGLELRARAEDASSLPAGDPFTLLDSPPYRPNPPIDDGTITSLLLDGAVRWVGDTSAAEAEAALEVAEPVAGGDFGFGRFTIHGEWAMAALFDHVLEMEWFGQGVLPGTGALPRQRWTFVGGSGTLNTFDIGAFRGDRVVFIGTDYIIPLPPRFRLPILGAPDLHLLHRVGMAWHPGVERDLEQNVGIRLQFFSLYLRLLTNPAEPLDELDFDVGLSWPFDDDRPWEGRP